MQNTFSGDPLAELPLGLAMNLARQPSAMDAFSRLSTQEKTAIIAKIQSAKSGDEARELIEQEISRLMYS